MANTENVLTVSGYATDEWECECGSCEMIMASCCDTFRPSCEVTGDDTHDTACAVDYGCASNYHNEMLTMIRMGR
jgi:hypothetical protein